MNDLNVIDRFMQTFSSYIDSGFGLLSGDVATLSSILVALDVTIAGLFWALDGENNVLPSLVKKILYVGAFAFIINNFSSLATIIYNSFSGLGLQATGSNLTAPDLMRPGRIAATGFTGAHALLDQLGSLMQYGGLFTHFGIIVILVIAWLIVVLSFFILAVQLFITILEFKLTTLAGFVLVPFALWNKTSFLAERVLGNVVASGIKVMVLAVIIGIGSTLFSTFTAIPPGGEPSVAAAMSMVLASIALFGLGIFGPGIATGLVAGAPQLGAGAVIGTGAALIGGTMLGAAGVGAAARGGLSAIRAGASMTGAAAMAYNLGQATSGQNGVAGVGAGLAGVARAGAAAVARSAGSAAGNFTSDLKSRAKAGERAAWTATGGTQIGSSSPSTPSSSTSGGPSPQGAADDGGGTSATPPAWARRLRGEQRRRSHAQMTAQAIKEGDRPGHGLAPSIREEEA